MRHVLLSWCSTTYIVPFSMFLGYFGQLEADQFVATLFETRNDVGDEAALDACGIAV